MPRYAQPVINNNRPDGRPERPASDRRGLEHEWAAAGAVAVEMEAATLFALAAARGAQAAALLVVSDLVLPERVRISSEELRSAERRMGEAALRALIAGSAGAQP